MFIGENTLFGTAPTVHVEADTNYDGGIGCQVAMVESYQNEFEFLKAAVLADVKECAMISESASDEDIAAMQEGVLSSVWNKLKELVKKIIAKVKGIFKGFIARLEAFMGKNGYAFFEKYKKVLYDGTDISKLKFKYCEPKEKFSPDGKFKGIDLMPVVGSMGDDDDATDIEEKFLDSISGGICKDAKTVAKDLKDHYFDSETQTDAKSSDIGKYCQYIMDKTSVVTSLEKVQRKEESEMNKWVAEIDKAANNQASNIADDAAGKDTSNPKDMSFRHNGNGAKAFGQANTASQKIVTKYQRAVGAASRALNSYNSAAMSVAKFGVAQSRRVAAIIVAYKSRHNGSKHESAYLDLYLDAVGEAAEINTLTELESL